jgi:hypothetical protein
MDCPIMIAQKESPALGTLDDLGLGLDWKHVTQTEQLFVIAMTPQFEHLPTVDVRQFLVVAKLVESLNVACTYCSSVC